MSWKIRFYRGLNKSIEVNLAEGRLTIGSDPLQADIVLVDEDVAPVHLILEVEPDAIRLLEWAGEAPPNQNGEPLSPGALLQALARQEAGPLLWAFCDQQHTFPNQLAEPVTTPYQHPARQNRNRVAGWMLIFCLVLALGFLALLGHEGWKRSNTSNGIAEQELRRFLNDDSAYRQVSVQMTPNNGPLLIKGYVDRNHHRLVLQQYLDTHPLNYRLELRTMEELLQGVDFILQKLGYTHIQSSNNKQPGWIRLTGELTDADQNWNDIESLLKRDVPGLLGIENQTMQTGSHLKRLHTLLAKHDLPSTLTYQDKSDRIEFTGQLDEHQTHSFYRLQQVFQQEFGNRPALVLLNNNRLSRHDELNFDVRAVSLGRVPYVVLKNNLRYPVGATTENGLRIEAIRNDAIVIIKGEQQFIIKLNRSPAL
ncbi:type III secretion system inner membrane ring subunit SctD [Photorhabdus heterorhabditis]|uniref:type III secretion system inner membrane ring subunit SctD n=1 Tax=Photorhabdus heterorhabditis TaxID=880156 RepID=UPI001562DFB1|nr:type III secretion system inner membrane ring subunit SctD [Photorhabdus heterorhabditis]NRN30072.1 type III secretion system inner membrane ring subunit SctD [Photorhabdus heterorhabditis subsp. aluminescens]